MAEVMMATMPMRVMMVTTVMPTITNTMTMVMMKNGKWPPWARRS